VFEVFKEKEMTSEEVGRELGMGILILAVFAGFIFPQAAKWILLVTVVLGLISWYSGK